MSETILIVDDDPVQRLLLEEQIKRFGFSVVTVEGGERAVSLLTDSKVAEIDAIILDLVMLPLRRCPHEHYCFCFT